MAGKEKRTGKNEKNRSGAGRVEKNDQRWLKGEIWPRRREVSGENTETVHGKTFGLEYLRLKMK